MAKKILIFSDGTGNTVGGYDSNVLRLCKMVSSCEGVDQLAVYDPGVGTMASVPMLHSAVPPSRRLRVIDDEARRPILIRWLGLPFGALFGAGTERNIRRLYRALIHEYEQGDEIFLFGFSRGAFTVRALAGVIYRCGVLRRDHEVQLDKAIRLCQKHFEACRSARELRVLKRDAQHFKRDFAYACNIRFLGVWDTVKSVGYMFPSNLPHTRHNPIVQTVRHALSLGERRTFYAPTTWGGLDGDTRPAIHLPVPRTEDEPPTIQWQDVQEVWFPGDHSDVGGGHNETALADVSLHWMINEAYHAGLRVNVSKYYNIVPNIETLSPDDVHDEMTRGCLRKAIWWLLEYFPRRDIDNEPPPPRLSMLRPKRLGPRVLAPTARRGIVSIHHSAERCYSAASAPWRGTPCRCVDTTERVCSGLDPTPRTAGLCAQDE